MGTNIFQEPKLRKVIFSYRKKKQLTCDKVIKFVFCKVITTLNLDGNMILRRGVGENFRKELIQPKPNERKKPDLIADPRYTLDMSPRAKNFTHTVELARYCSKRCFKSTLNVDWRALS